MVKYTISIPAEIDKKISEIAKKKGITNNNEIRDMIIDYYSQAAPVFSYSDTMKELEEELSQKLKNMTDDKWAFRLADLEAIKKIERISGEFKPSTIKATIGKTFFKKVEKSEGELYSHIVCIGTKQRIAVYCLCQSKTKDGSEMSV